MDTARVLAVAQSLIAELDAAGRIVYELHVHLKSGQYTNAATDRRRLEQLLADSPSSRYPISWLRIADRIGSRRLYGSRLLRHIASILDDEHLTTAQKVVLLQGVEAEIAQFAFQLRGIETGIRELNETAAVPRPGRCEIGALFPSGYFSDVDDLSREISELHRHVRTIAELAGERGFTRIATIESGSIDVFLDAGLATGALFASVIWGLLRAWKEVREIQHLHAQTRKIDIEVSELLAQKAQRVAAEAPRGIADDIMAKSAVSDDARRNELSIAVRHTVAYVEARMKVNILFEVTVAPASRKDVDTTLDENDPAKIIQEYGTALSELHATFGRPLLEGEAETDATGSSARGA